MLQVLKGGMALCPEVLWPVPGSVIPVRKCELAHTRIEEGSLPCESQAVTHGGYCIQAGGGNHARQQQESNLCRVDHRASAPRLTVLWGGLHETRWHLETGRVHDRGYRQQRARKRVRQAGGGLSYIYGCWSRVRICDHERR